MNRPPTTLVCAASAVDAARWAREEGLHPTQVIYVSSATKIDGQQDFTVVRLPGFYGRRDADEIDAVIRCNERKRRDHVR